MGFFVIKKKLSKYICTVNVGTGPTAEAITNLACILNTCMMAIEQRDEVKSHAETVAGGGIFTVHKCDI